MARDILDLREDAALMQRVKTEALAAAAGAIPGYQKAVQDSFGYERTLDEKYHRVAQKEAIARTQQRIDSKSYAGMLACKEGSCELRYEHPPEVAKKGLEDLQHWLEEYKNAKPGEIDVSEFITPDEGARKNQLSQALDAESQKLYKAMDPIFEKHDLSTEFRSPEDKVPAGTISAYAFYDSIVEGITQAALDKRSVEIGTPLSLRVPKVLGLPPSR